MAFSYRPQTLHDTIHTVLPGEVLPAIPGHSEFIAVRLFVFQLTASRKDWRPVLLHSSCRVSYFNSQPHEEADGIWRLFQCVKNISTHSLTKRLTPIKLIWRSLRPFQLTASRRGWPDDSTESFRWRIISTHSLTKRLTTSLVWFRRGVRYFNSQPHEEAD